MRFSYAESMGDPAHYAPLARAAEAAGFDSFVVPDSLAYPEESDSRYPYTPDGDRRFLEDKPFLDPFALIAALAAVTTRLRFTTFVLKLPVRSPVLVAKAVSSVAVLSGGRLRLGVGISPWPEDFQLCGQDFATRGPRSDEMIEILRGLLRPAPPKTGAAEAGPMAWRPGAYFSYRGRHYTLDRVKLSPVPPEPVPILVGGHSAPALRRAARLGDGWMHAGGDAAELERLLGRLRALRGQYGRTSDPFEVHVISLDAYAPDGIRRLEDAGVTDVIVGFRDAYGPDTQGLETKLAALHRYSERVIQRT